MRNVFMTIVVVAVLSISSVAFAADIFTSVSSPARHGMVLNIHNVNVVDTHANNAMCNASISVTVRDAQGNDVDFRELLNLGDELEESLNDLIIFDVRVRQEIQNAVNQVRPGYTVIVQEIVAL